MEYSRWTDDDLRRVLGANPKDLDAVIEAAKRFERVTKTDSEFEDLEEKIEQLEGKLQEANDEAQGLSEDCDAGETRIKELQAELDKLHEAGAALL